MLHANKLSQQDIKTIFSVTDIKTKDLPKKRTLFAFDIDLTLVDYADRIMSDFDKPSKYSFIKKVKEAGGKELVERAFTEAKFTVIENEMLDFIAELQKEDFCTTIGFTARRTGKPQKITKQSIEDVTIATLKELKIDFSSSFPGKSNTSLNDYVKKPIPLVDNDIIPYEEPGPALFKSGVLFSAGYEKGCVLDAFFSLVGTPEHFVLIDDKRENLENVLRLCASLGISATGYHYTALSKKIGKIDENIVDCQLKSLADEKRWISDQDAQYLLEEKKVYEI